MKPWQVLGTSALVLNGVVLAALALVARFDLITSVLAGALLPVIISAALLFWADSKSNASAQQLQNINIIGFIIKVVLIGSWAVFLLQTGVLSKVTFIVILLINFLAWHGVEAYYWRLFMAGNGLKQGENS